MSRQSREGKIWLAVMAPATSGTLLVWKVEVWIGRRERAYE